MHLIKSEEATGSVQSHGTETGEGNEGQGAPGEAVSLSNMDGWMYVLYPQKLPTAVLFGCLFHI